MGFRNCFPGGTQSPVLQEKAKAVPSEMKAYEKTLSTLDNEGEMPLETFLTLLQQREQLERA